MLRAAVGARSQALYFDAGSGVCRGGLSGVLGPSVVVLECPLEVQLNRLMIRALYRILQDQLAECS
jgi:hypothetical protein